MKIQSLAIAVSGAPLVSSAATLRFDLNITDFGQFSETARYTLEVQEWDAPIIDNTGQPIMQYSFPVLAGSVDFAGETTVFSPAELTASSFELYLDDRPSVGVSSLSINAGLPLPDGVFGDREIAGGQVGIFNQVFTEGVSEIPVERNSNDLRYLDASEHPDNRGTFLHQIYDSSGNLQEDLYPEISNVTIPEPSALFLVGLAGTSLVFRLRRRR